jgi:Tol biopolymer transport system component/endonuclease/exonuclease/phosphatase family metal-dependent hydrolase
MLAVVFLTSSDTQAQRAPVLKQIKTPHDYYFREMYLPQVSSGPQGPTWSPDGQALIYSMQGSLWRQDLDSTAAVQLTAGPGYDHQPDWSPDGKSVLFTRYHNDAMELQLLDMSTGKVVALTAGGDVNLEPRWSPDGTQVAFVSTQGSGLFQVFTGAINNDRLHAAQLVRTRRSKTPRYYYSEFDHQISPVWSPAGDALLYISNPETPYGTGDIWYHPLAGDTAPFVVRREETTWRARPDIAPDGRRIVYSSYLGRQWHQLWLTTVTGKAEPFPMSYGDFDTSDARWSPDGEHIAYTVNENGNTELRVLQIPGGKTRGIDIEERRYAVPMGSVRLSIVDDSGDTVPARAAVVAADGRAYAPHAAWAHADDSFDRTQRAGEARYFHVAGEAVIDVPVGEVSITVWRGPENQIERRTVDVRAATATELRIEVQRLELDDAWSNWRSGDVHVHMNYGGNYLNTPQNLVRQAEAEDLDVVFNLIVNKEQRVPDVSFFSGNADRASNANVVLQHSQEFHTGFWGHLALLGLGEHLLLPDYSAYPETAAASLYPDNATVTDMARQQGAITGYVHPFLYPLPDPANDATLTNALPIDAALGKVDFYEVLGFADHRASAQIWYRLLNCGFRISAAGGTDAMANYASLRGPVGMNRTYVYSENWPTAADARRTAWIDGLRDGRSMATNGPLLGLSVDGAAPGETLSFATRGSATYSGFMRSAVPLDQLQLVQNGEVIRDIEISADGMSAEFSGVVELAESSWLVLRASASGPHPDVFDMYPYATTSPVYVDVGDVGPRSIEDIDYFLAWIARVREAVTSHEDFNAATEKERILGHIDAATAELMARRAQAGTAPANVKFMTFNIEWGGKNVAFEKVLEAIRLSGADIVGIQEAEGNLEELATELGWHFDERSYVISRFPLIDIPAANGKYVLVEVRPQQVVAVANLHLPSDPYGPDLERDGAADAEIIALEQRVRMPMLTSFLENLAPLVGTAMPVLVSGDFNAPGDNNWPVPAAMRHAGFRDSWREVHPDAATHPGYTWWAARPRIEHYAPGEQDPQGRIDMIWSAGPIQASDAALVGEANNPHVSIAVTPWPSDHRGVVATFAVVPAEWPAFLSTDRRVYSEDERPTLIYNLANAGGSRIVVTNPATGQVVAKHAIDQPSGRLQTQRLAPGRYVATIDNTDNRYEREFWVRENLGVPSIATAKQQFAADEPVLVRWQNAPGYRNDYIALYAADSADNDRDVQAFAYIDARPAGNLDLRVGVAAAGEVLRPGRYIAKLMKDDGYEALAESAAFEVR